MQYLKVTEIVVFAVIWHLLFFPRLSLRDAWYGTLADGLTSFYAGFVVFSILGFMAKDAGLTMEEISKSASGVFLKATLIF